MPAHVDYYFTPSSPWTYLGHDRFVQLLQDSGSTVRVLPVGDVAGPPSGSEAYVMPAPVASFPGGAAAQAPATVSIGMRELPLDLPLREARDAFERAYFEHHLAREHGSMTRVAEKTGLERTHLYRKLKQLGIDLSRGAYRKSPGL